MCAPNEEGKRRRVGGGLESLVICYETRTYMRTNEVKEFQNNSPKAVVWTSINRDSITCISFGESPGLRPSAP